MKKPVILCVDDEKIVIDSLKGQLKRRLGDEYRIETAESGDEALALFDELREDHLDFPVIICDQIMPGMKGDELLQKTHDQFPKTLKILLTGQADVEAVGRAVNNAHLYRYIKKPWEQEDICLTVSEAIRSHFQDKQIEEQNKVLREMNVVIERKLAQTLAEQTVILENAIVGILFMKEGKVARVNQKFEDLFKVSRNDIAGQSLEPYFPEKEEYLSFMAGSSPVLARGEAYRRELVLRRGNGTAFWCSLYGRALTPNDPDKGAIWIVEDITNRKEAEDALLLAKEKAEQATKLKDKFISLVSHDLRAPIASNISLLRLLNTQTSELLGEDHKRLLTLSVNCSEGLIKMIDQLLNLSRLNAGAIKLDLRFFEANSVSAAACAKLAHLANEKGIALENKVPSGIRLLGDRDLIEEVVGNLVSNAIKFCKAGNRITVHVPEGKPSTIAVSDTGVGISPKIINDLFRQEVKTSTVGTSGEKGTGLGLPFCKEIMMMHGGDLTVESKPGEGSTFFATLPENRPLVMVVDDQEVARSMIAEQLRRLDVNIIEAENGQQALEKIIHTPPHVVISDLKMPVMDGFEFIERLKQNPLTKSIPVIVATSEPGTGPQEKAFRLGADDFVSKPVIPEDFLPRVKRFLG